MLNNKWQLSDSFALFVKCAYVNHYITNIILLHPVRSLHTGYNAIIGIIIVTIQHP